MNKFKKLNEITLGTKSQKLKDKFYDNLFYIDNELLGQKPEDIERMAEYHTKIEELGEKYEKLKKLKKEQTDYINKSRKRVESLRQEIIESNQRRMANENLNNNFGTLYQNDEVADFVQGRDDDDDDINEAQLLDKVMGDLSDDDNFSAGYGDGEKIKLQNSDDQDDDIDGDGDSFGVQDDSEDSSFDIQKKLGIKKVEVLTQKPILDDKKVKIESLVDKDNKVNIDENKKIQDSEINFYEEEEDDEFEIE